MTTYERCFQFAEWISRNGFVYNKNTGEWMFWNQAIWVRIAKTTDELFFDVFMNEIEQT